MTISSGNFTINVEHIVAKGKVWNVRLHKKRFPFKKLVSSDWFLDELQAEVFAKQLVEQLTNNPDTDSIRRRQPGWTLKRAAH